MPSKSRAQHNLMEAVAHDPKFAERTGIPQTVGEEFAKSDYAHRSYSGPGAGGHNSGRRTNKTRAWKGK